MSVNALQKFIDKYIGGLLCLLFYPLKFVRNSTKAVEPRKILFVKLWAIGESVLTLPTIDAIRKRYGDFVRIDVLTRKKNSDVYTDNAIITSVHILTFFRLPSFFLFFHHYDLAFDLEPFFRLSAILTFLFSKRSIGFSHGVRSILYDVKVHYNDKQHVVQTYLDLARSIGIHTDYSRLIPLGFSRHERGGVDDLLRKHHLIDKVLIGFAPGSGGSAQGRRWNWANYRAFIERFQEDFPTTFIVVGAQSDKQVSEKIAADLPNVINAAGKFTLKELFYLMTKFHLFIGNDSGPIHIAAAQGVPTLGLFGPNTPVRFAPYGPRNRYIYKGTNPVINVHKGDIPDIDREQSMEKITVADVLSVAQTMIND